MGMGGACGDIDGEDGMAAGDVFVVGVVAGAAVMSA